MGLKTFLARRVSSYAFGDGRLLMHKPWDSDLNMAKDPHLNLRKLASLSHSGDAEVRGAVAASLSLRLTQKLSSTDLMVITVFFNKSAIIKALRETQRIDQSARLFAKEFINSLNPKELSLIAEGTKDKYILLEIIKNKNTPRPSLIFLAETADPDISYAAYERIEDTLSEQELSTFAKNTNDKIREKLASHIKTPRNILVELAPTQTGALNRIYDSLSAEEILYISEYANYNSSLRRKLAAHIEAPRTLLEKHIFDLEEVAEAAFPNLEKKLTPEELAQTTKSSDYQIKRLILKYYKTPRMQLIDIISKRLDTQYAFNSRDDRTALAAYLILQDDLSPQEFQQIAQTNRPVILELLAVDKRTPIPILLKFIVHPMGGGDLREHIALAAFNNLENRLTVNILFNIINSASWGLLTDIVFNRHFEKRINDIAASPNTPYYILIKLAKSGNVKAFDRIEERLSSADLDEFPKFVKLDTKIASHSKASPHLIARIIKQMCERIKIIDREEQGHSVVTRGWSAPTREVIPGIIEKGPFAEIETEWVVDLPELFHFGYDKESIKRALQIINAHSAKKQARILAKLEKISPELLAEIKQQAK